MKVNQIFEVKKPFDKEDFLDAVGVCMYGYSNSMKSEMKKAYDALGDMDVIDQMIAEKVLEGMRDWMKNTHPGSPMHLVEFIRKLKIDHEPHFQKFFKKTENKELFMKVIISTLLYGDRITENRRKSMIDEMLEFLDEIDVKYPELAKLENWTAKGPATKDFLSQPNVKKATIKAILSYIKGNDDDEHFKKKRDIYSMLAGLEKEGVKWKELGVIKQSMEKL